MSDIIEAVGGLMDWNVLIFVAFAGAMVLLFLVLKLGSSRLLILFRAPDRKAATKQSIESSLLNKLGGGGASPAALCIMAGLSLLMMIYRVVSIRPFDLFTLIDALVAGCLVFVFANVIRLVISPFLNKPVTVEAKSEVFKEYPYTHHSQTNDARYWILVGEIPTGPFTSSEILAQIQSGKCQWITMSCVVGGAMWLPLNQVLPHAPLAALAVEQSPADNTAAHGTTSQAIPTPRSNSSHLTLLVVIVGLGLVAYWLYSTFFAEVSLSPQQVCQAFNFAKSPQEAKNYATPNMYAALGVLFIQTDDSDDGSFELTAEQPAPSQIGGDYVGFQVHLKAEKSPIVMHGVFHLLNQSGWKVNDMIFISINDQSIDPPISVAREYEFFRDPQHPIVTQRQLTDAKIQAQQWHTNTQVRNTTLRLAGAVVAKSSIGKWIASVIGVILVGIYGLFNKRKTDPGQQSSSQ